MGNLTPQKNAGETLRKLIRENYASQEEFANDYGADLRTISRYINNGINNIGVIQELAIFFDVDFISFFQEMTE